ncbi:MAG TPA: phosphoribosylanthranilate isomerase [Candidatus Sulfotelmatobacter sp.]|nr:phosphoribosylanthranilate isomerase [Candidatus Sulfotelmatobacter sp.]
MTWVKICGMTNLEDALTAVEAGADAVGFVFHPESPRNINPAMAADIVKKLPPETERVGVFVGDRVGGVETKKRIVRQACLTAIQAYNATSLRSLSELQSVTDKLFIAWPAQRVVNGRLGGFRWRSEAKDKVSAILLDSGAGKQPGGTGRTFDWEKTAGILASLKEFRFIIAGGLTVENVDDALSVLHPWGVDVVSGVEASPGKKDPDKVRAFVNAVREYDRKVS